jgi:two-component system, OmpR family, response regulator
MAKVLIVEDDDVIAQGMARHLEAAGFDPLHVSRGDAGLARLRFERPDVCVLDLMLPGRDGWNLIETARAEGIGTPIVVVSARDHTFIQTRYGVGYKLEPETKTD